MGLDAVVFCDCVEEGRLRIPHPYPRLLYIASNGAPEIRSKDPVKVDDHDNWMNLPPCEHEGMMLPGCYQASAGHVARLNRILSGVLRAHGHACPVLMRKVFYSGTHCGDHLAVRDVRKLSDELDQLEEAMPSAAALTSEDARLGVLAVRELRQLVKTALTVQKPIAF